MAPSRTNMLCSRGWNLKLCNVLTFDNLLVWRKKKTKKQQHLESWEEVCSFTYCGSQGRLNVVVEVTWCIACLCNPIHVIFRSYVQHDMQNNTTDPGMCWEPLKYSRYLQSALHVCALNVSQLMWNVTLTASTYLFIRPVSLIRSLKRRIRRRI